MHHVPPRTLQRLFRRYVGVGPKWVLKRLRIHRAAERLTATSPPRWTELALELGYYDLRSSAVRQKQADLAKAHGIHGFCYYYYWFGGNSIYNAATFTLRKRFKLTQVVKPRPYAVSRIECAAVPAPAGWVPVRWPWSDAQSLDCNSVGFIDFSPRVAPR